MKMESSDSSEESSPIGSSLAEFDNDDSRGDSPESSNTGSSNQQRRAAAIIPSLRLHHHHLLSNLSQPAKSERLLSSNIPARNIYVNSFGFNQDGSCFAAATTEGFRVFTCSPLSEFARREGYAKKNDRITKNPCDDGEGYANNNDELDGQPATTDAQINLVSMLYRSHSFAFVSHEEPRKVQLWNDQEEKVVGTIRCCHVVLNVLMAREVVVAVTESGVYVYLAGTISPIRFAATSYNPQGVCAISFDANVPWKVACPAVTPGAVRIVTCPDTMDVVPPFSCSAAIPYQGGLVFQSHQNPLSCLALNASGSIVATASVLGTVIKTFNTRDGARLHELRLASVPHRVLKITFRGDGMFLAATSNSFKVHIFKLSDAASSDDPWGSVATNGDDHSKPEDASHFGSSKQAKFAANSPNNFFSNFVSQSRELVAATLKTMLPKYFVPIRSFAQLALPVDSELDVRSCSDLAINQHRSLCRLQRRSAAIEFNSHCLRESTSNRSKPPVDRLPFKPPVDRLPFKPPVDRLGIGSFLAVNRRANDQTTQDLTTEQQVVPCCPRCGFGRCWTSGPLVAFAGFRSNHFYVVHHNGFFYEGRFNSQAGGACQILSISPWFAPRKDFYLRGSFVDQQPSMARNSRPRFLTSFEATTRKSSSLSDSFNFPDNERVSSDDTGAALFSLNSRRSSLGNYSERLPRGTFETAALPQNYTPRETRLPYSSPLRFLGSTQMTSPGGNRASGIPNGKTASSGETMQEIEETVSSSEWESEKEDLQTVKSGERANIGNNSKPPQPATPRSHPMPDQQPACFYPKEAKEAKKGGATAGRTSKTNRKKNKTDRSESGANNLEVEPNNLEVESNNLEVESATNERREKSDKESSVQKNSSLQSYEAASEEKASLETVGKNSSGSAGQEGTARIVAGNGCIANPVHQKETLEIFSRKEMLMTQLETEREKNCESCIGVKSANLTTQADSPSKNASPQEALPAAISILGLRLEHLKGSPSLSNVDLQCENVQCKKRQECKIAKNVVEEQTSRKLNGEAKEFKANPSESKTSKETENTEANPSESKTSKETENTEANPSEVEAQIQRDVFQVTSIESLPPNLKEHSINRQNRSSPTNTKTSKNKKSKKGTRN